MCIRKRTCKTRVEAPGVEKPQEQRGTDWAVRHLKEGDVGGGEGVPPTWGGRNERAGKQWGLGKTIHRPSLDLKRWGGAIGDKTETMPAGCCPNARWTLKD